MFRLLLAALFLVAPLLVAQKPLKGWVVVIDPGHGGTDPGAHGIFNGQPVPENEYVADVALRLARLIRQKGGLAPMTISFPEGVRGGSPAKVLEDNRNETFTTDNSSVRAGSRGLAERVRFGNQIQKKYPKQTVIWISIHFDRVGSPRIEGVRIIASDTASRLAQALQKSFGASKRLRTVAPLVKNGDASHGIRHLYVLSPTNTIKQKVLIELGNFPNAADSWRIRDGNGREMYARTIAQAVENIARPRKKK